MFNGIIFNQGIVKKIIKRKKGINIFLKSNLKVKKFYSSKGFALIYNADLYEQRIIDKKISNNKKLDNKLNNEKLIAMHTSLKRNTLIQIINPENSKVVETKIFRRIDHPKIFNLVVSKKIVSMLELDENNPYVEVFEVKKNKTFISKESIIFEEEKIHSFWMKNMKFSIEAIIGDRYDSTDSLDKDQIHDWLLNMQKKHFVDE